MKKNSKIYIAGHKGMVGSAIWRNLESKGYLNLIGRTLEELDLLNQKAVADFFEKEKPEYVILAAAKVGGILANNTYRADFIYENLQIQNNIIHQSYLSGVKKLLFLGSSCIYPKDAPQPLKEEYLLTGPLEYTNEPYAIAKIAGIKMCEAYRDQYGCNFISVMPTNLYGPNDNFNLETSHVLPALIRKIHLGKCLEDNNWDALRADLKKRPIEEINGNAADEEILRILSKYGVSPPSRGIKGSIEIWGSGKPMREFLWSEEMADACVFIMENIEFNYSNQANLHEFATSSSLEINNINIGSGKDVSIAALAEIIKQEVAFNGQLIFNDQKPDGTMRKLTQVTKLNNLGWKHKINIEEGISKLYQWYISNTI